ncbi:MAG: DUF4358 domain-containing protein [Oscillospiraceae bacterium]|nr:DUF4358 domain-containing protein [Oscillospiraceae bacterium]
MKNIMKFICVLSCTAMFLMTCSCGSKNEKPMESSIMKSVSMYDLQKAMKDADSSLPDMSYASSSDENAADLFTYVSELDYGKVDSYFLSYSSEGLADEIAVIAVKNENDVKAAEATLRDHAADRVKLYTQYDPSQTSRAENALIFTEKQYAVLIISNNQNDVKSAFESFINQE